VTKVARSLIIDALAQAGLLVGERGVLPSIFTGIADDSRAATSGGLFVAVRGVSRVGHVYLAAAAASGAAAAIVEDASRGELPAIVVTDARRAAAVAAAAFYGHPTTGMTLVAVTGTNGKTTTVGMLRHLLDADGARSASIGTLGILVGSEARPLDGGAGLTTPGPVELQRILRELADHGVRTVAMEVSSHALAQHRVEGIRFDAAVFTNFTRDHLDFHGTMDAYLAAKESLLGHLAPGGVAVRNADDPAWGGADSGAPGARRVLWFGQTAAGADVRATDVRFTARGSTWTLSAFGGAHEVRLPLIGDFNVSNALGAAAAASAVGLDFGTIALRLGTMPQVPGRLEILSEHPTVLRDYAHTPDALERALAALRPFTADSLIVVFGAGGDRDRGKRPLMGQVALRRADRVIVTSDNPRTEDPEAIIDEIVAPLPPGRFERITDRREAIARALSLADRQEDVVLIAGKGHETYQVRGHTRYPFDEKLIVADLLTAQARALR
jgi:UDP-N-acetylmuramoyl-L-alanyl-D-glutamate--2,6-diaminopimelate ligase